MRDEINKPRNKSKLAFLIRFLVVLGLIGIVSVYLLFLVTPEILPTLLLEKRENHPMQYYSLFAKIFTLVISILHYLFLAIGLFAVAKILDLYVNGEWFLSKFGEHLKTFGMSLIFYTLLSGVKKILLGIVLAYEIGENRFPSHIDTYGPEFTTKFSFVDTEAWLILLIGILLIVISKVHKKAVDNAIDLEKIV